MKLSISLFKLINSEINLFSFLSKSSFLINFSYLLFIYDSNIGVFGSIFLDIIVINLYK